MEIWEVSLQIKGKSFASLLSLSPPPHNDPLEAKSRDGHRERWCWWCWSVMVVVGEADVKCGQGQKVDLPEAI